MKHLCILAVFLLASTAAQAVECQTSGQSWREVDGRRCWFDGHRRIPKSELHWAAKESPAKETPAQHEIATVPDAPAPAPAPPPDPRIKMVKPVPAQMYDERYAPVPFDERWLAVIGDGSLHVSKTKGNRAVPAPRP